ncbi:geranylgeranyl pyrophosphate synthase isoform X2 [Serinus canaria]|uniref:geranylgeranyl pyrophosphate synthase isoform X2 n=1 Tax=Serinus canaria TaxID=9135 RepID=UPI0021CCD95A|nr:geranylgeranyl pyrophosphate synthase isoform X2 [Serinus canaria]
MLTSLGAWPARARGALGGAFSPQEGKVAPGGAEGRRGAVLRSGLCRRQRLHSRSSGWSGAGFRLPAAAAEEEAEEAAVKRGKQVRTKLSQAFNHWLNVPEDKIQVIIEVTEMLHNASLLVDDIEDNSKLRRGFPVAHSIYGIPSVINCANYVYFLGLEKVLTLDHPDAVKVFTRQLLELHKGQGLDIYWRDTYTCPTEDEYKAMVLQKTGGLFGLAVGLMQLFSNYKKDLKPLLNTLGLFFQIRDDYANLHSKEYSENKSFCEDLTEGKFSFPTIHAIWSRPESTQVQNILRQRTENIDIKKYCVHYLENVGSFEYTRNTLKELESEAYKQIESLGGNPELVALVQQLSKMFKETEN